MAELLVRVYDKTNPSGVLHDVRCLKRGDIVVACDNGWPWSRRELSEPFWRIFQVPEMSIEEAQLAMHSEQGDPMKDVLHRQCMRLDLEHPSLPVEVRAFVLDDARSRPLISVSATLIRKIITAKAPGKKQLVFG